MKTIDEIGLAHGTDKASDKHDYCRFYEEIVGHLRDQPCSILEFGVRTGSSIAMWSEAFPKAHVVGCDITWEQLTFKNMQATLVKMDARNEGEVRDVCRKYGPFDLVVDDSAHKKDIAQNIVTTMFPRFLKPGGWLVIEDIHAGCMVDLKKHKRHDFLQWCASQTETMTHHGMLHFCGPNHWGKSTEFDKAMERIVFVPGIMAMKRRS